MPKYVVSNQQAERFLISIVISGVSESNLILSDLLEEDFSNDVYRAIFKAAQKLYIENKEISIFSLSSKLEDLNLIDLIGGLDTLTDILDDYDGVQGFEEQIKILKNKTLIRSLFSKFDQLQLDYKNNNYNSDYDFLNIVDNDVNNIIKTRRMEGFLNFKEIAKQVEQNIVNAKKSGSNLVGTSTGYSQLNNIINGLEKGDVIVLAARPNVGKTTFGLNIALNVAENTKGSVLLYSLEMKADNLLTKLLSAKSNVPQRKIVTGKMNQEESNMVAASLEELKKLPIYVSESSNITINDIEAKSQKFKIEHSNLKLIVIDYLGLINTVGKFESERIRIGHISHRIHNLARELEVPIILICQLKRLEKGSKPKIQDLRDSGDIEQDADKVILLHRNDYQNFDDKAEKEKAVSSQNFDEDDSNNEEAVVTEVIVGKNRNGPTGVAYLLFFKNLSRFNNPTKETLQQLLLQNGNL